MSTLLGSTVKESTAPSLGAEAGRGPRVGARRRVRARSVVGTVVAVAAVIGLWRWAPLTRTGPLWGDGERFTVVPRTFGIVLKEKGELKAAESKDIKCEVEGRSTIISLIEEGTAVKEGDLLVELASDEIEERIRETELKEANAITAYEAAKTELEIQRDKNASDIRKAKLDIELKQLALEKYEKGDWEQARKDAEIAIDQAKILLERRQEDYEASKELFARNFITQTEYKEDEFNHQKAAWDLEKAEHARQVLEQYTHVASLRERQSAVEEATKEFDRVVKNAEAEETRKVRDLEGKQKELELIQDKLAKLRRQKVNCVIRAPGPGFVVYYSEGSRWGSQDDQIKEGASVHERQVLMQLPDTSTMIVALRVHEAKTDKLNLGQQAVVSVEGIPGRQFTGRVTKIAVLADTQNRWLNPDLKEYETEILLDPADIALKPGVTAHVEILVDTIRDVLAVPVHAVYTKGRKRYVFRTSGSRDVEPVEITLGATGTEWAEVSEHLSAGDQILLAFDDEHTRMVPDLRGRGDGETSEPTAGPQPADSAAARPPSTRESPRPRGDRRDRPAGPRARPASSPSTSTSSSANQSTTSP